jgi:hypothetical protein
MTDPDEPQEQSPTAHILDELQLYGFRPFHDEPDPRPKATVSQEPSLTSSTL